MSDRYGAKLRVFDPTPVREIRTVETGPRLEQFTAEHGPELADLPDGAEVEAPAEKPKPQRRRKGAASD